MTHALRVAGLLLAVVICRGAGGAEASGATPAPAEPAATVVLQQGTIYDGSGKEGVVGDVVLRDGKIVAVGKYTPANGDRVIDCRGMIVAPGFIDLHTHCDSVATDAKLRPNLNYLTQGCTTVVTGNCGGGALDVEQYFARIDRHGAGTNVIHLVPHGSARAKAMGGDNRAPTAEELQRMRDLVDRGMRAGAWGMSTGLIYTPGLFAKTDELIALAKVVAAHHGIYASHIRGEGSGLLKSIDEAIGIGRAAGLSVQISHLKSAGKANWGLVHRAATRIEEAQRSGVKVTADQYPYIASSNGLGTTLFSPTQIPGGMKDFAKRIAADAEFKQQVRKIVHRQLRDASKIMIATCKKYPEYAGKSLDDIARQRNMDVADLAIEIQANGSASVVKFTLCEEDVRYVMTLPWVATGSDGGPQVPAKDTCPHPRSYGTFPRKIGYYALREKIVPVEQAIRSATGLPADILGLGDRGYLRPKQVADVVVLDPKALIDRATFDEPHQYSTGVRYVFVAGQAAIDDGKPAKALYGHAIRHAEPK